MSDTRADIGSIGWFDLTVEAAPAVRDFYAAVVGWEVEEHPMGEYSDYVMRRPDGGDPVAGVCHARGPNAGLPAQWLLYVNVADLERSVAACRERGGAVVQGPRDLGPHGKLAVVRDPAGAHMALIQPPA